MRTKYKRRVANAIQIYEFYIARLESGLVGKKLNKLDDVLGVEKIEPNIFTRQNHIRKLISKEEKVSIQLVPKMLRYIQFYKQFNQAS